MVEETRVDRARTREPVRATVILPVPDERTRLRPGAPARVRGVEWEERVAMFALALDREGAGGLLSGLAKDSAERASVYLEALATLPSPERQGRLATEFGTSPQASQKLRALWAEAGPALKREIYRQLPPYHRSVFPDDRSEAEDAVDPTQSAPALRDFAARLIREATR